MTRPVLEVPLTIRDLTLDDVAEIEWSGGSSHLAHVAEKLVDAEDGTCRVLGVAVPSGLFVAMGGVAFEQITDPPPPGIDASQVGLLWMLAVRESWQSVGVGTALTAALEQAARDRGRTHAILSVEHDNPRAAALYRRLGYVAYGSILDGWSVGPDTHFVTICTQMVKRLT